MAQTSIEEIDALYKKREQDLSETRITQIEYLYADRDKKSKIRIQPITAENIIYQEALLRSLREKSSYRSGPMADVIAIFPTMRSKNKE